MTLPTPFNIEHLLATRPPGALIITANRRLARHIEQAYNSQQLAAGKQAWQPLNLYPLDEWLSAQWKKRVLHDAGKHLPPTLLTPLQELMLWETTIKQNRDTPPVARPATIARLAQQAYNTLGLWQIYQAGSGQLSAQLSAQLKDDTLHSFQHGSIDNRSFAEWLTQFEQACRAANLISQVAMQQTLLDAFQQGQLLAYPDILLVGFDQLSPLHQALIEAASQSQQSLPPQAKATQCTRLPCQDREAELWAAARWTQQQLTRQQLDSATGSPPSIAVIVPDLNHSRDQVERIFSAVLEPHYVLPDTPRYALPFNISAAIPLSQTPIISSALNMLALNLPNPPLDNWLGLQHTPFAAVGFNENVELTLREAGLPTLSCNKVLSTLTGSRYRQSAARYMDALQTLKQANLELGKPWFKRSLGEWLTCFLQQLAGFGWPGKRPLDSIEHQQLASWQRTLIEINNQPDHLPFSYDELTAADALALLRKQLDNVSFQPESSPSPVQILGLLEGSGLHFDNLWLVGMNDHLLPANPASNPFIPLHIQRQYQMPHATPERELMIARQLLDHYRHNCTEVVASFAQWEGDQALRPSALITDPAAWLAADPQLLALAEQATQHPYLAVINQTDDAALETFDDDLAPAVDLDHEQIAGGSGIIKSQSGCPFQAFASFRLNAYPLPEADTYDLAMERGTCLHNALEHIWGELKTLERLNTISHAELTELITDASKQAIAPLAQQRPDLYQPRFTELEQQRLQRLLGMWLDLETQRAPFEVIACEHSLDMFIQQLPIRLRIDRIDRMANGSLALVDYKTGAGSITDWAGERPREPQLPLYTVMLEQQQTIKGEVSSVCFARINIKDPGYIGLGDEQAADPMTLKIPRTWPDLPTDWAAIKQHWQQTMETLVTEFIGGEARVDPSPVACTYCALDSLCRVRQQSLVEVAP